MIIEQTLNSELAGYYKIEAKDPETGEVRLLADWFPNLITNYGMDLLGGTSAILPACQVGSGAAPPANTDTGLVSRIAGTTTAATTTGGATSVAPFYAWVRRVFEFAAGSAAGNLAEVGVGPSATTSTLFSRALILDGGGNPTTITVLPTEILQVTYEVRCYLPTNDVQGSTAIGGVTYYTLLRKALAGNPSLTTFPQYGFNYNGYSTYNKSLSDTGLGLATAGIQTTEGSIGTHAGVAYVNGNYYKEVDWLIPIGNGNYTNGIRAIGFGGDTLWQLGFFESDYTTYKGIPKTSSQTLTLRLRQTWARRP